MKDLEKVKDNVRKLYEAQQEKKQFDSYYEQVRKKEQLAISNFMFTNLPKDEKSFEVVLDEGKNYYTSHVRLNVTRIRTKKVIWDVSKLKKKLNKETYNNIVDKTYIVNNMQGLIKYLKSCGVDPKKFKKFIEVEEKVNETKLNVLYDTGKMEKKDIEECYEMKMGEPYIRLKELNS